MTTRQQITKQRLKQMVRRTIGEPYVGKRLKQRSVDRVLGGLQITPSSILDAGTEDATFVYWLADRYPAARVTAVDIDTNAIQACVAARPAKYVSRIEFHTTGLADLTPASFDLITAFDVLEHISDDAAAAEHLSRALRPGGTLLVHVPRNQWTTWGGTVHRVPDEDAWQVNPGHVRSGYSPDGMQRLLTEAGLRVEQVDTWLGRWGALAHEVYARLEHPAPLRLLTLPITDLCAALDARNSTSAGNTVFARAVKPL